MALLAIPHWEALPHRGFVPHRGAVIGGTSEFFLFILYLDIYTYVYCVKISVQNLLNKKFDDL